ncbi:MAG: coniferyl aldehyde dehydrogenase [Legionellaceae bacterium]|nr:coniferyl aldehyde dehydrogenase [Legionellaceae bacterium]HCA89685.1 coniferyl aldehyde dehydrogenase [Legionellales bacterium]|tara:strand:- start:478 stop:1857 length:1380 start_codon:yes stop_codon:yes gene_type:complete
MALDNQFQRLKTQFINSPFASIAARKHDLKILKTFLQNHANELVKAIDQDFQGRATEETFFLEIFPAIKTIDYCIKHLKSWCKTQKRTTPWYMQPAHSSLLPQPLGVVGIMVPWNYPLFLSMVPLAYALAAGNCVMIKFAEFNPNLTAYLVKYLLPLLDHKLYMCAGQVEQAKVFSQLAFDHLLFTGSSEVGSKVMQAASTNLTPVTLELGGKSPAIISQSVQKTYLKRLFMGKLFNAGQTCVAPDYLWVEEGMQAIITTFFKQFVAEHYGHTMQTPDYTAIINKHHHQRLEDLLQDAQSKGAEIIEFGFSNGLKMAPKLVFNCQPHMRILQEEIFGPILPVRCYQDFNEVLDFIQQAARPLALYYFGENKTEINRLKFETHSGALTINDTLMHLANHHLPFGGVGQSGMGQYQGIEGFLTFSHLKPIFKQHRFSPIAWFYPPFHRQLFACLKFFAGIK